MNWKILIAGAAASLALASQAQALDFNFSFSADPDLAVSPGVNIPGTVTGRIFGLQDNTDGQQATDVEIFSYPVGIQDLPGTPFSVADYAAFLNGFLDNPNIGITQNDFDVQNGQITFAIYQIFGGYFDMNVQNQFNSMVSPDSRTRVQNLGGFGAITFSAAPEPATWGLMLLGFGGLGAVMRSRRRRALLA
jgi:PEP-CTERM motif